MERKDFDVDIEFIRVGEYTVYGLVYHCISDTMTTSPREGRCDCIGEATLRSGYRRMF